MISKAPKKERPRIPVLQYHDQWVCVNKPAGMTIYRSYRARSHKFVLSTLLKHQLARKVNPVHRLDHQTSGAILFAFDSETCAKLHASLTCPNDAVKEYIALVRGDWKSHFGQEEVITIDKPLNVDGVLKEAKTEFHLLASIPPSVHDENDNTSERDFLACSLLLCRPKTGRTHQIRRHAYALGHPIIGDTQHGDSKVNRWWRENRGLDHLFLHCFSMDLPPLGSVNNINHTSDDSLIIQDHTIDQVPSNSNGKSQKITSMDQNLDQNERIQCIAPLLPELSSVLKSENLKDLWKEALSADNRLEMEPIDDRGGTFRRHYKKRKN